MYGNKCIELEMKLHIDIIPFSFVHSYCEIDNEYECEKITVFTINIVCEIVIEYVFMLFFSLWVGVGKNESELVKMFDWVKFNKSVNDAEFENIFDTIVLCEKDWEKVNWFDFENIFNIDKSVNSKDFENPLVSVK